LASGGKYFPANYTPYLYGASGTIVSPVNMPVYVEKADNKDQQKETPKEQKTAEETPKVDAQKTDENKTKDQEATKFRFKAKDAEPDDAMTETTDPLDSSENPDAGLITQNFTQKETKSTRQKIDNPLVEGNDLTPDQLEKFKTKGNENDDVAEQANVDIDASANPRRTAACPMTWALASGSDKSKTDLYYFSWNFICIPFI